MLNISTAFKQALANDNRNYQNRAVITLTDNTVITVDNQHIMLSGVEIEDAVGDDNSFTALGSAIINSATLTLYNNDEIYSDYVFEGARVVLYTGLELSSGLEEVKKGTFIVDTATYGNATITLNLLDNMSKFDKPYSLSSITFPTSMRSVILDACTVCGVQLASNSASFPHNTYSIPSVSIEDSTTFREVISKCATIAGCFASCNVDGELELKWFDVASLITELEDIDGGEFDSANPYATGDNVDGGTFNPWDTGDIADGGTFTRNNVHYITKLYSQNIAVDDIVITQVKIIVTTKDENDNSVNRTYISGQDGYTIEISNNEFITESTAQTVLNWLATQFIGLTFRPCNITHTNDPSIEAGDVALIWDTKGNEHPILITRTNFNPSRPQTIVCGAESPLKNSSVQFSQISKAYAELQKQLKDERTSVQQAIDALAERISDSNSGLYKTVVPQSGGGSVIYYHNQPELEDSDIQLLISSVGVTVSADGGTTWYGLTVDGQLISSIMNAIGINFDWGVGGELLIQKNEQETLYVDADTGTVRIKADSFSLSSGETLASTLADAKSYTDNSVGSYDSSLNQEKVFNKLTNNGTAQGLFMENGQLYINFTYGKGGTLKLGGNNNVNGLLQVLNASGNVITTLNNSGINTTSLTATKYINVNGDSTSFLKIPADDTGKSYMQISKAGMKIVNPSMEVKYRTDSTSIAIAIDKTSDSKNWLYLGPSTVHTVGVGGTNSGEFSPDSDYPFWVQKGNKLFYMNSSGQVRISGNLSVNGTKNRTVATKNYGERYLYCYETPSPLFGDVGEGTIGEDGKCYVWLDSVFAETITTNQYQVFLQKYGNGDCWVSGRKQSYFIVEGTPNMSFGWELKAKQSDFDQLRLENNFDEVLLPNNIQYGVDAITHIKELNEGRLSE